MFNKDKYFLLEVIRYRLIEFCKLLVIISQLPRHFQNLAAFLNLSNASTLNRELELAPHVSKAFIHDSFLRFADIAPWRLSSL